MKLKKIFLGILIINLVFSFLLLRFPRNSAFAQTFDPYFNISVVDTASGANSNLTGTITQLAGEDLLRSVTFYIPPGWDITDGKSIDQNEIIGGGKFSEYNLNIPGIFEGDLIFRNDLEIREGDKAHWLLDFADPVSHYVYLTIDAYVTGDISSGHTIEIIRTVDRPWLTTPAQFDFTFYGKTDSGKLIFANPILAGKYTWTADMKSESSLSSSQLQKLSMPGSVTPKGEDVYVPLGDNVSITFDSVTAEGQTNMTTSEKAPPESTGQFQLSGGLYYDFDTTAEIACPCIVTLPYDPKTTDKPSIYHLEDKVWLDVTTEVDDVNHLVTGVVSSFSYFVPGQPAYTTEWLSPVKAFENNEPIELNKNQALPLNLVITDGNGDVVKPEGLKVQLIRVSSPASILAEVVPELDGSGKHLKEKFNFKEIGAVAGQYILRVLVGNTAVTQDVYLTIS